MSTINKNKCRTHNKNVLFVHNIGRDGFLLAFRNSLCSIDFLSPRLNWLCVILNVFCRDFVIFFWDLRKKNTGNPSTISIDVFPFLRF